jgi:hypothetical protein
MLEWLQSVREDQVLERTNIRTKGFEEMKRCGRSNKSLALCFRLSPNVFLPLAFSIMPLSIMVMIGATRAPAAPADSASTPIRSPSFDVFQSRFVTTGELSIAGVLKPATAGASASGTGESVLGKNPSFAGAFIALLSSPIAAFSGD